MNIVTAAELKRRGFAALEESLVHGPVHLIKHNRQSAVVLREADYSALSASASPADISSDRAWRVFTDRTIEPAGLNAAQMADRLAELGDDWSDR